MTVVELSDEETVAVLAQSFTDSLATLHDRSRQIAVLKRIAALLASPAPRHYVYETVSGCSDLEVIRVGDDRRIYCRLVTGLPPDDERYNVLFAFYVDTHDYRSQQLERFDEAARRRLAELSSLGGHDDLEAYLEEQDAFTAAEMEARIERLTD